MKGPSLGFMGEGGECTDYSAARVVIIPYPLEASVTYGQGTAQGPGAIIKASHQVEFFDMDQDREIREVGIYTAPPVETSGAIVASLELLEQAVLKVFKDGKFPVVLGGEHTTSLGPIAALQKMFPAVSVLHLDAHSDLRSIYENNIYSHACVMRRIFEMGLDFVQVGIRSMDKAEWDFIRENRIQCLTRSEIQRDPCWYQRVVSMLSEPIYITLDIDVLDPSIMPSTGTPEPNGLLLQDLYLLFQEITKQNKRVLGMDVVELAPISFLSHPDFLVAKLIYQMIGLFVKKS